MQIHGHSADQWLSRWWSVEELLFKDLRIVARRFLSSTDVYNYRLIVMYVSNKQ